MVKKGNIPWNKGIPHSEETKRKISLANKGKIAWNKGLRGYSTSLKGKTCSEETKEKISKTKKRLFKEGKIKPSGCAIFGKNNYVYRIGSPTLGRHHTEEAKRKLSDTRKRLFKEGKLIHPLKGKHHSEETKRKIGLVHKGKTLSKELKEKLSLIKKGKRNYFYGKKHSEETKRKISLSRKGKCSLEDHYNWLGGISFEPYDLGFTTQFKNSIRKRENQICMLCGIHREKLPKALFIHHINYDKKLTIPQNCVSLCNNCHTKTNTKRKHWIKFFQSLLSERYGYQYSEDNEIIMEVKKW